VSLEEDDVAVVIVALALEEVVEADFVEPWRPTHTSNMSANAVVRLVRLDHHRERVSTERGS